MLEHLRPLAPLNWSPADNFHITSKFIGTWPEDRLEELKSTLAALPKRGLIATPISGFGWFPNPHHPRFLYAGVRAPQALHELFRDLNSACAQLGIAVEERDYSPHLTLARIKGSPDLTALRQAIAQLPSADFGISTAAKLLLYRSDPGETHSTYSVIGDFTL